MNIARISLMLVSLLLVGSGTGHASSVQESTDAYGPFGTLHLYQDGERPQRLVLFISGDGGWNLGVVDMARSLAHGGTMVAGIDITHYIGRLNATHGKCSYAAAQFESLSQYLQKKHHFAHYAPPVLVGYSSGATMVYATLAQSPANTFAGGISLGFCPDLKTAKPFCRGNGALGYTTDRKLGFIYKVVETLPSPWKVLQGDIDKVCYPPDTKTFVARVGNSELIALPKVGHGFSVQRNWMPQFKRAFENISASSPAGQTLLPTHDAGVGDLPLVILPTARHSDSMAVVISGDGGWASIDKQIGESLNASGIPVVGLNALQYFWERKTPDIAAADLGRILQHFGSKWAAKRFILVGYSRGADTLPFMVSRLPEELKSRIAGITLLGLETEVDFEFHVGDWLGNTDGQQQVLPEVAKLAGMKLTCIFGADETDSACRQLDAGSVNVVQMPGGHHFDGRYRELADIILQHSTGTMPSPGH